MPDVVKEVREVFEIINRQARRTRVSIAIICFILGFLLVTQFKGQLAAERPLQDETEKNLAEIARDLGGEVSSLEAEQAILNLRLYKFGRASDDKKSVLAESKKNKEAMEIAAGTTKVEGRGVRIIIKDEKNRLNGIDLMDVSNELRAAGAEALAVNNQRIGTNTAFVRKGGDMLVGGRKTEAPYTFTAIGDPSTLQEAIAMAGGIRDTLTSSLPGVTFDIITRSRVDLPGMEPPKFEYSKSVTG